MQSLKSEIYSACCNSSRNKLIPILKRDQCSTWANVLKQAETTVGYSTSFLNLRWLLSDEIANLASSVNKILGTNHPILKTARNILVKSDVPSWGLIILLVSKASSINTKFLEGKDRTSGILHTQRMIAEIVETLKTGIYFHKSLQLKQELKQLPSEMNQGNKIALLVGDYLITKSYKILAEINNSEVEEIISSALRDLCEEEFFGERNDEDNCQPSARYSPDDASFNVDVYSFEPHQHKSYLCKPKAEWAMRNCLAGAFLLGKGCYAAVKLGERPINLQNSSFTFGVNLALACQARKDLNTFENQSTIPLEKVAAPVLFHLEQHPDLGWKNIDDDTLRQEISAGVGVRKTEKMLSEFLMKADMSLEQFPRSEARDSLRKMLEII
ncbi:all trans-polyprenyl-diphosphate synthase PDSS2-like [Coccinella septempunctata]|uniref:all trans-polyprenyl-diphosphate synthase PDSS2-like n=1 Tax=Coccinella septempunctata TaxID=41139 RepID=UPI001D07D9F9|nr:all trans-polyprenyl-diphosphate synthase PDSS2-like [Coccinella septempunctata]